MSFMQHQNNGKISEEHSLFTPNPTLPQFSQGFGSEPIIPSTEVKQSGAESIDGMRPSGFMGTIPLPPPIKSPFVPKASVEAVKPSVEFSKPSPEPPAPSFEATKASLESIKSSIESERTAHEVAMELDKPSFVSAAKPSSEFEKIADVSFGEAGMPQSSKEKLEAVDLALLKDLQQVVKAEDAADAGTVSKDELATILEGFANVLRGDRPRSDLAVIDRSAEVGQMKELLLEAQETIITLLNDRVYDRAKIAKLESEVRLMPDLQAQAHRALGMARRSEEFEEELVRVRGEVERLRAAYVRAEGDGSWWRRLLGK